MHSSLSLAVGYNTVVTHGKRSCNNVVVILAKDKPPVPRSPPGSGLRTWLLAPGVSLKEAIMDINNV